MKFFLFRWKKKQKNGVPGLCSCTHSTLPSPLCFWTLGSNRTDRDGQITHEAEAKMYHDGERTVMMRFHQLLGVR
jgi:hypothetical protein